MRRHIAAIAASAATSLPAAAQWDPPAGAWLKSDQTDLRVMTWNVRDGVVSTADKRDAANSWSAIARVLAALQPDVLLVQEAGDQRGDNSGSTVDNLTLLAQTCRALLAGGPDPRTGDPVEAFAQRWAPEYDLPFVTVSVNTDGFNRNVILSRFPFADLNGDCQPARGDFFVTDGWGGAGNGGIRGFQTAEIDLPDDLYAGDLTVGNVHLKSGPDASDLQQRLEASQRIAWFIDEAFNGGTNGVPEAAAGLSTPLPSRRLHNLTPFILGGDLNEDERTNRRRGPADWLTQGLFFASVDGTDRDRSDAALDDARSVFGGSPVTLGGSKLDYLAWQDSIAHARRSFIFRSSDLGQTLAALPDALLDFPAGATLVSAFASDHFPVIADLILPLVPPATRSCARIDLALPFGTLDTADVAAFLDAYASSCSSVDLDNSGGTLGVNDVVGFVNRFHAGCP